MTTAVEVQREDAVTYVTFRGERGIQTFSPETRARLSEVLAELADADACRIVVFRAEGRTFIAGADINEFVSLNEDTARKLAREGQRLMSRIADLDAVTIAAIHGPCAGGGCELALACDLRMAAESAQIGLPEVSLGLVPGWGGTVRATRLLGPAIAKRMILAGELFPAAEALQFGIVDNVSPDAEFHARVDGRVKLLLSRGPQALRSAKRLIDDFSGTDLQRQFEAEVEAFGRCFATNEGAEGSRAFLEKRPPDWG